MTRQGKSTQVLQTITGSVFAAPGMFLLIGNLDALAVRWRALVGATSEQGLGLLSSVILASSFSPQQLLHGVLQRLCPSLALVLVGIVLLWNASTDKRNSLAG